MANFFGPMAVARESAFFKKEQEADLQRYVEYLKKKGIISKDTGNRSPPQSLSFEESINCYEVLGEILQQGTRLNVPNAALLQARIKAKLPPLTEEEFWEWKTRYGVTGPFATAVASNMRLQPNRYTTLQQGVARQQPISPEAAEASRRQFMVAMRGLLYGSALAGMIMISLGIFVCQRYQIQSVDDMKPWIQNWASRLNTSLQSWFQPIRQRAQRWTETFKVKTGSGSETRIRYDTEFSRELKKKFNDSRR